MRKLYFRFLSITFFLGIFLTLSLFYYGYFRREQFKRSRLSLVVVREITGLIRDRYPLSEKDIPFLKELKQSYEVDIKIVSPNFNYTTDKKIFGNLKNLVPIRSFKKTRELSPRKRMPSETFFPEGRTRPKTVYFADKKTKLIRGVRMDYPGFTVILLKSHKASFARAFVFFTISIVFLSIGVFLLIKKWYVEPLEHLETSIKSIEKNIHTPELFTDNSGTLTPIFNALNQLKQKIVYEINLKEEMLRDISHDLKTPLSRIKLALEFVENEKIKKKISEDVSEIENLVNSILAIYSEKRESCKTNLKNFFSGLPKKFADINFEIHCSPIEVSVCEEDLKRVFYNLIENSIKYASVERGITIIAKKSGNNVLIEYIDCETKGEKPELSRIFDYFYKKDKSRNKDLSSGFGLGLSIVKKIVENNNGKIHAEFSDCEGLKFTIVFPSP